MDDVARIAKRLTVAQRRIVLRAEISDPHPIMPTYHGVKFYAGDVGATEVQELCDLGLFTLPIATGGRGTPTMHGEIHQLGQSVRRYLEENPDAG